MSVKDIIRQNRLRLGLTMKELSDKVGVSEATISRWESGEIANMKQSGIAALCKVLGISPSVIMGWDDSDASGWYLDPETAKAAQEMYDKHRVLFDASRKLKPESIKEVEKFIEYQLAKENHEDDID
jgi:transcriptional regulator with XRE-family HTH domain